MMFTDGTVYRPLAGSVLLRSLSSVACTGVSLRRIDVMDMATTGEDAVCGSSRPWCAELTPLMQEPKWQPGPQSCKSCKTRARGLKTTFSVFNHRTNTKPLLQVRSTRAPGRMTNLERATRTSCTLQAEKLGRLAEWFSCFSYGQLVEATGTRAMSATAAVMVGALFGTKALDSKRKT